MVTANDLSVNFRKTKPTVMGPPASITNLSLVHCSQDQSERVSLFQLMSLHFDADFSQSHAKAVISKATKQLYSKAVEARRCPSPSCTTITLLFDCYWSMGHIELQFDFTH